VPNSGSGGSTGTYQLIITRVGGGSTSLTGITSTATSGTPPPLRRRLGQHGQTITITGAGLRTGGKWSHNPRQRRRHARHADGHGGAGGWRWDQPASSGAGRCDQRHGAAGAGERRPVLQVVPTLTDVDQGVNDSYRDGGLRLRGSGFMRAILPFNFDNQSWAIPVRKTVPTSLASTWRMTAWT